MIIKDTYLPHKRNRFISDIGISVLFTIFLVSAGILAAVYFRPLYYLDIRLLDIEQSSGMPSSEIKENYNALIEYCSPFYQGELQLPTLPSSEAGLGHFRDVKNLFQIIHITAAAALTACLAYILYKRRHSYYRYLPVMSVTAVILPLVVGLACLINFNQAFTLMHQIFFRNDDWIFDPAADPIILLLPEKYFLHCTLLILLIVLCGSLISLLCYFHLRKKFKTETLMPMKKNYYY